ncbi:hypothetical protein ACFU6K_03100 [Kitasatospora sp. NPDC057512]|uniref:hypothetical protein n=1 Tax=Kitasatospora sp. NPDC057512 TaxID=3346154 RepID=UPI0036C99213
MADVSLSRPSWTDPKIGTKVRVALWLLDEVGEGNVFTLEQVRAAFPGAAQVDRRLRDLRDDGWEIETSRTQVSLDAKERLFARAGAEVWDPAVRAAGRRSVPRRSEAPRNALATDQGVQSVGRRGVWQALEALSSRDRALVLAWMAMGRRPGTAADNAWFLYEQLPEGERLELMAQLGELVSGELGEDAAE